MFFGDNVHDTRQLFFQSWQKYRLKQPLLPLEEQLVAVIMAHPEYHALLENSTYQDNTYYPEMGQTNPFLHLGLHLAIRDQVASNRPPGITKLYQQLVNKYHDTLHVEHLMMDYLAECLWQAQRNQSIPNENNYLASLTLLLNC